MHPKTFPPASAASSTHPFVEPTETSPSALTQDSHCSQNSHFMPPESQAPADVSRHSEATAESEERGTKNEELPPPPINPPIHSSSNPLPLSALAAILGCTRSTIRHFADRLGYRYTVRHIGPRQKRTACLTPDQANAIAAEVERETASSPPLPVPQSPTLGFFYLLQLEPKHDPGRFKLGFSANLESRLHEFLTVVPLAKLIATWPCHRSWERTAIISTAQNAEQLSQEVFRCTHVEDAVAAAHRFFAVMPKLTEAQPIETRAGAPPVFISRRGDTAKSGEAAVSGSAALRGHPPQSAKHQTNPTSPPTDAFAQGPPQSRQRVPQGRDAAPPASQTSRWGHAEGGAEHPTGRWGDTPWSPNLRCGHTAGGAELNAATGKPLETTQSAASTQPTAPPP